MDAYNQGHQLYTLRSAVNTSNSRIDARKRELERVEEEIKTGSATLIAQETTIEDRVLLLADLKKLSERTGEIESEIYMLVEDRALAERELAAYESIIAASGF